MDIDTFAAVMQTRLKIAEEQGNTTEQSVLWCALQMAEELKMRRDKDGESDHMGEDRV